MYLPVTWICVCQVDICKRTYIKGKEASGETVTPGEPYSEQEGKRLKMELHLNRLVFTGKKSHFSKEGIDLGYADRLVYSCVEVCVCMCFLA